jgi:hypothetical protein
MPDHEQVLINNEYLARARKTVEAWLAASPFHDTGVVMEAACWLIACLIRAHPNQDHQFHLHLVSERLAQILDDAGAAPKPSLRMH